MPIVRSPDVRVYLPTLKEFLSLSFSLSVMPPCRTKGCQKWPFYFYGQVSPLSGSTYWPLTSKSPKWSYWMTTCCPQQLSKRNTASRRTVMRYVYTTNNNNGNGCASRELQHYRSFRIMIMHDRDQVSTDSADYSSF